MSKEIDKSDRDVLLRWRLALGPAAEKQDESFSLTSLEGGSEEVAGVASTRLRDLDDTLSFVYDDRPAGLGASKPYIPKWLTNVREFFDHDVVALIERDAIEKKGLTRLLLEPETLHFLERNVELVATLLTAKGIIPDEAKIVARAIVKDVVEQLRRKLETSVRTAILGALRKDRHSPLKLARNIDWQRSIRANLKGWDKTRKRIIPERFHFYANQRRRHEWDVLLLVDQSASMSESVVYASVMATIFASLDVLRTKLIFFDTEIVDMTSFLGDPVELLFGANLGGGTDINRAVAYAETTFIERPERTILVLVSDLFEGGDADDLKMRIARLTGSKVKVLCLLALTDTGRPTYDHEVARSLSSVGAHCFGATPRLLVEVLERAMKGQDFSP